MQTSEISKLKNPIVLCEEQFKRMRGFDIRVMAK